jgi:hypothetical protein
VEILPGRPSLISRRRLPLAAPTPNLRLCTHYVCTNILNKTSHQTWGKKNQTNYNLEQREYNIEGGQGRPGGGESGDPAGQAELDLTPEAAPQCSNAKSEVVHPVTAPMTDLRR